MKKLCCLFVLMFIVYKMNAQVEVDLYDGMVPNSNPCKKVENAKDGRVAAITVPKLYAYFPKQRDSSKSAVIICPGGGYARLAIDHEGFQVAQEFNKKGIVAFVLKNRVPIDSDCVKNKEIVALQDAQQAILLVRRRAAEFGIDANKVGIMGFSAGGHLASTAATHFNQIEIQLTEKDKNLTLKPDFLILGYPVITMQDSLTHKGSRENLLGKNPSKEKLNQYSNELQVTPQTPPTFLIHAADDKSVPVENSLNFFTALRKNNVPAEMIILQSGGHGFGLKNKAEPVNWMLNVFEWLKRNKMMNGNIIVE